MPRSGDTVQDTEEIKMKFALIGAAAVAAASFATPALAQAVIENPGYCAQYYPNANCQNLGPGNPYTSDGYKYEYGSYAGNNWQNGNAYMEPQPRLHRHHRRHRG
jgi:opacity protein-like surface antigen